jgi:hypothetical protein
MYTAEMDCESHLKISQLEGGNSDAFGTQVGQGGTKPSQILDIGENCQIGIPTKLRSSV